MAEKKEGFFKRLFRFGKKKREEEPVEDVTPPPDAAAQAEAEAAAAAEAERVEQERAAKEAEEKQKREEEERAAAEHAAREEEARLEAERKAKEEREAAEEAARKEQERLEREEEEETRLREEAALKAREEEKRAEEERLEREATEKAQIEETAQRAEEEERARQEAEKEQARKEAQAAREEEERKAEERRQQAQADAEDTARRAAAEQEVARLEAEARASAESEAQEAAAAEADPVEDLSPPPAETPPPSAEPEQEPKPEEPAPKRGWFSRLREGLSRSSSQLTENIAGILTKRKLDEETLQDLEDILIQADLGVETSMAITDGLASQRMGKDVTDEEVREFMAGEIEKVLDPVAAELELDLDHTPHVMLVVGVNGSGKTTTIGKLSQKLYDAGFSTLLVAGDTFRAAAIEQLRIWGDRTQSPTLSRPLGSDAAGLAFDAYEQAREEGRDVMLMDTAGRLQNKTELMEELAKIIRVLKKQDPTAPHTVLLTLDATTGQNALQQVEIFQDVAGVNGLVMTKLDGTARGGIMVAIASKFKLPVYFIGVGEQVDDLEPFEARDFARGIVGLAE